MFFNVPNATGMGIEETPLFEVGFIQAGKESNSVQEDNDSSDLRWASHDMARASRALMDLSDLRSL